MSDKKHIDRIFQEKLKDLNVAPSSHVWDNISMKLADKKKDRKILPIWIRLAGIAAALLLMIAIGYTIFGDSDNDSLNVVDSDKNETIRNENKKGGIVKTDDLTSSEKKDVTSDVADESIENYITESGNKLVETESSSQPETNSVSDSGKSNKNAIKSTQVEKSNNTNQPSNLNQLVAENETESKDPLSEDVFSKKETADKIQSKKTDIKKIGITDVDVSEKINEVDQNTSNNLVKTQEEMLVVVEQEKEKIPLTEDVIVSHEDIYEEEKEKLNRWQVSPNIAPVYFNAFGDGSSIHEQLVYNKKSGDVNLSLGVNVSYAVNDKLSIRSGINRMNLGYSTSDVVVYENVSPTAGNSTMFRNIKLKEAIQNFSFISGSNFGIVQLSSIMPEESMALLNQEMTFYEIPVEFKYRMSDKKVGISIIGGFSTLMLGDNQVSYEINGSTTGIGEAVNINNISFSANFGLGLDYRFSKNMSLNIDPMFKYQMNTFNNISGTFEPYIIGVYSGLNFKF